MLLAHVSGEMPFSNKSEFRKKKYLEDVFTQQISSSNRGMQNQKLHWNTLLFVSFYGFSHSSKDNIIGVPWNIWFGFRIFELTLSLITTLLRLVYVIFP